MHIYLIASLLFQLLVSATQPTNLMQNADAKAQQMLQLVNAARMQNNIRPLCLSNKLTRAAQGQSTYEASVNTMTHDGPVALGDRFLRQGYQPSAVAENVGFTSTPFAQVVFDIWMSSPEHRANILDPQYVHFGSASAPGSNGLYYWTQLFAVPMNANLEVCDFSGAARQVQLGGPGNGMNFWMNGAGDSNNYNGYDAMQMSPAANCVMVDSGVGGKSLSCKMAGAGAGGVGSVGPNNGVAGPYNPVGYNPPGSVGPYNPVGSSINNPPGSVGVNNPPGYGIRH